MLCFWKAIAGGNDGGKWHRSLSIGVTLNYMDLALCIGIASYRHHAIHRVSHGDILLHSFSMITKLRKLTDVTVLHFIVNAVAINVNVVNPIKLCT